MARSAEPCGGFSPGLYNGDAKEFVGVLAPERWSSVVRLGAAGVGRLNVPATGERADCGACVDSVASGSGGAARTEASDMDAFRFRLLVLDAVGLRIEKPNVPKTLLFFRECRGVVKDTEGGEEGSESEIGVDPSLPLGSMGGIESGRPLDFPLPHQVPIQSLTDERSDLVLACVSILGAV